MKKVLPARPQRLWLAIAGTATLVLGASFVMLQQSARLSANDLPISLSQSIKSQMEKGTSPNAAVPSETIDLRTNNSAFAVITDSSRHVLASSATLDGQSPLPPNGVFEYAAKNNEDTFTWEPSKDLRLATHVTSFANTSGNGFIVTGQSLKEYEKRISIYGQLALMAWVAVLAWTFLTLVLLDKKGSKV
jgi:hypothetical protein